jgi:hypothetical protein
MSSELVPYSDLKEMAAQVVKGGLFPGIKTPEQAMTLFLVAQSEGLHPMTATMRYNIIQNRPAMKAEAMLASFMERGGTVDWTEYTDEAVTGVFKSAGVPKGVSVRWTLKDVERAGLTRNPTWKSYPKQMLKARVASDGVRMCDPAVNQGRYTPEEVSEFEPRREVAQAEIVPPEAPQAVLGPSLEEKQLKRSLGEQEAIEVVSETVAPGHCTLKGCGGEVELYASESKSFPGREYWMCQKAYEERERLLNEGTTVKFANGAVAAHYREWASPWEKVEPEEPSIFDPAAISKQVAAKLAAGK